MALHILKGCCGSLCSAQVSLVCSKRTFKGSNIRMTMLDDKLSSGKVVVPSEVLVVDLCYISYYQVLILENLELTSLILLVKLLVH